MKITLPSYHKAKNALEEELGRLKRLADLDGIENKADVDKEIGFIEGIIRKLSGQDRGKGHS